MKKLALTALLGVASLSTAAQTAAETRKQSIEEMLAHCRKFNLEDNTKRDLCAWLAQNADMAFKSNSDQQ